MLTSVCWQESDIAVTWEAVTMHDKYREEHSQETIELNTGSSMEELKKGSNDLKGIAAG